MSRAQPTPAVRALLVEAISYRQNEIGGAGKDDQYAYGKHPQVVNQGDAENTRQDCAGIDYARLGRLFLGEVERPLELHRRVQLILYD